MKEDYSKRLSEIEDDKLKEKIDKTNYELLEELASIKRRLSDIESKIGIR